MAIKILPPHSGTYVTRQTKVANPSVVARKDMILTDHPPVFHRGGWHKPRSPISRPHPAAKTNIASIFHLEPGWEEILWWRMSDEVSHAYHFWHARPMDALVAIGSFQGYNLANRDTNLLIMADYDPRQQVAHTLFGGLILNATTPGQLIDQFYALQTRAGLQRFLLNVQQAELDGKLPLGTHFTATKLSRSEGLLSIGYMYATYAHVLEKIRAGEELNDEERANFDWLTDEEQYRTVRGLYYAGNVADINANFYGHDGLNTLTSYLAARGNRISTIYFSDPCDVLPTKDLEAEFHPILLNNLRTLPLHDDAIIQWTSVHGGIPKIGKAYRNYNFTIEDCRYLDKIDGRYAYVEMPVSMYTQWILSDADPEELYIWDAYERLNIMLDQHGTWVDSKVVVNKPGTPAPPEQNPSSTPETFDERMAELHRRRRM